MNLCFSLLPSQHIGAADTAPMKPLHRRLDSPTKGRHLVASRRIEKSEVVFVDRPLLSLQSLGNSHAGALTCRRCRCFIGGPDLALAVCSGQVSPQDCFSYYQKQIPDDLESESTLIEDDAYRMVPCRNACGEMYCSDQCARDHWDVHGHCLLCTGLLPDNDEKNSADENKDKDEERSGQSIDEIGVEGASVHPLLRFKIHAIRNNEILIMVADLCATAVSAVCRRLEYLDQIVEGEDTDISPVPSLEDVMAPYFDFTLEPWWKVATAPLLSSPAGLTEASELDITLRGICSKSSSFLQEAILSCASLGSTSKELVRRAVEECNEKIGMFTGDFFGKIIGSFEQNAMGIRSRHPLCRDIFDQNLRIRCHKDLVQCIEVAGMIGEEDNDNNGLNRESELSAVGDKGEDEAGFSAEEIAEFIAALDIDEENKEKSGSVEEDRCCGEEEGGDSLDALFVPLDGTAMYFTACKMNHSCSPNIVARYQNSYGISGGHWGSSHPLVIECVALRDIDEGEELSISYIEINDSWENRQEALANYGFICNCTKCQLESNHPKQEGSAQDLREAINEDDLFGDDSSESADPFGSDSDSLPDGGSSLEGHALLQQRKFILDKLLSPDPCKRLSLPILASISSFITQTGRCVLNELDNGKSAPKYGSGSIIYQVRHCLLRTIEGIQHRNMTECLSAGKKGERICFSMLYRTGSWPTEACRAALWCFALSAGMAYADGGSFIDALRLLDKAAILGLDRKRATGLFEYAEYHATACRNPGPAFRYETVPPYQTVASRHSVEVKGLQNPIVLPIEEVGAPTMSQKEFEDNYVTKSAPIAIRGFAKSWRATNKWRNLDFWANAHGHRLVPIELGDMAIGAMKEAIMSIEEFVSSYLESSAKQQIWPLSFATSRNGEDKVAYLAQHQLFEQIPALLDDIVVSPSLCGNVGPSHINVWIGTGGTRTPLHFDTYENLFVQVVGVKYVRIYSAPEAGKLYVIKKDGRGSSSYASQGNMSCLNCEMEDFTSHPLARDAKYGEVLLFPGDCVFIPARSWHYVRSLTTSMSVNFWF